MWLVPKLVLLVLEISAMYIFQVCLPLSALTEMAYFSVAVGRGSGIAVIPVRVDRRGQPSNSVGDDDLIEFLDRSSARQNDRAAAANECRYGTYNEWRMPKTTKWLVIS